METDARFVYSHPFIRPIRLYPCHPWSNQTPVNRMPSAPEKTPADESETGLPGACRLFASLVSLKGE